MDTSVKKFKVYKLVLKAGCPSDGNISTDFVYDFIHKDKGDGKGTFTLFMRDVGVIPQFVKVDETEIE
jgi:uncharacterized protein YbbK (DUF523 family)